MLAAAGEERAGAFARRGDDRPAKVIGAAHVSASEPASIRVLDREYTVGVEPGERDSLMTAAKLLDARMREVRGANRMAAVDRVAVLAALRSEEHTSELQSLMRISYAVFCLKKKKTSKEQRYELT